MNKINKFKLNKLLLWLSPVLWFLLWELFARQINQQFVFPTATSTLLALCNLVVTLNFWKTILMSFLRIGLGLVLGIISGVLLGILSSIVKPIDIILSPFVTVLRCTPVASFIMILWFLLGSAKIPAVISVLMVMPLIWQSTKDGISFADRNLIEVSAVFKLGLKKKIRHVYLPSFLKSIKPAIINSAGLAWKAGIAAEIITYTAFSIGAEISDAKNFFESAEMFAWTLTVVLFSLAIEVLIKRLLRSKIS